ncbi:manganese catalase family protein, partial [Clavibacter michiganensis]|uniref:manganese catalase family protein n=1 Tax=Clavibacter michiganensis TaxID=28447 RepID=UPI00292CDCA5
MADLLGADALDQVAVRLGRGAAAKPYRDLIQGVGTEEISHRELIRATIARLLDGPPAHTAQLTPPRDPPRQGGAPPPSTALHHGTVHP